MTAVQTVAVYNQVLGGNQLASHEVIDGFGLTGGMSNRMGQDKALMRLGGKLHVLQAIF